MVLLATGIALSSVPMVLLGVVVLVVAVVLGRRHWATRWAVVLPYLTLSVVVVLGLWYFLAWRYGSLGD